MDQGCIESDPRPSNYPTPVMNSEATVLRPSGEKSSNENHCDFKILEASKENNFGFYEISGPSIKLEKTSGRKLAIDMRYMLHPVA